MVIQTNIPALTASRHKTTNANATAQSLKSLSSGFRINQAADDAAGLSISEKMRGQINGLAMAEQNTQHAVSLIQTAEGGLNESHSILQRMRELAVQSSNGTYTEDDRAQIGLEFEALKSEFDRIADSTHFNNIKLLDGSIGSQAPVGSAAPAVPATSAVAPLDMSVFGVNADGTGLVTPANLPGATFGISVELDASGALILTNGQGGNDVAGVFTSDGKIRLWEDFAGAPGDFYDIGPVDQKKLREMLGNYTDGTVKIQIAAPAYDTLSPILPPTADSRPQHTGFEDFGLEVTAARSEKSGKHGIEISRSGGMYVIDVTTKNGKTSKIVSLGDLTNGGAGVTVDGINFKLGAAPDSQDKFTSIMKESRIAAKDIKAKYVGATPDAYLLDFTDAKVSSKAGLVFQVGANGGADQRVWMSVEEMSTGSLGLTEGDMLSDGTVIDRDVLLRDTHIDPISQANLAIEVITKATDQVSAQRAGLGALQNKLDHTLTGLGNTKENLTSSESVIRDLDMAAEMSRFTASNVLDQAAQAMMAQANNLPQGVLTLIR